MAVDILNETTLSEAVAAGTNEFAVGSTTNVTAGTSLLVVQGTSGQEVMKVQEVPSSGRVGVLRGFNGTRSLNHPSGARVFIADPDDLTRAWGFVDRAGNVVNLAGNSGDFPQYALPGARGHDGKGNEYVMVELSATVVRGATLLISKDGNYTASVLTSAGVGPVGVLTEGASSDQYVWAQIYGDVDHAKLVGGSSLVTSLGEFGGASSVSTPSVGLLGRSSSQRSSDYLGASTIYGMFPTSAATTSASTSASSETGLAVSAWLNYPYAQRAITT